MVTKVLFLTSGTQWTVPADCTLIDKIECIGAGGSGTSNNGAGGGAYAAITNLAVTPGSVIAYSVGVAGAPSTGGGKGGDGGPTWFKATNVVYATGGFGPLNNVQGNHGLGGNSASCVGTVKFSGGSGALLNGFGGGGGGAAGPSGVGGNAPQNTGNGGTANGGTIAVDTAGAIWTSTHAPNGTTAQVATAGPAGGATQPNRNTNFSGINGKVYGAGATGGGFNGFGGTGGQGIIVITYTKALDPVNVTGSQTMQAATQTGAISAPAGISGSQTLAPITQTGAISVFANGAQYLKPITQSGAIGVVAKITGSQTLAPITQIGRTDRNISGFQILPPVRQVNSIGTSPTPRRILLGKLPNGNNGLRISQPGYDCGNDPIDNERLIFSSEWNEAMPIYMQGFQQVAMGIGNQGPIVTVNFPSLGYIPYVEFICRSPADAYPPTSQLYPDTTRYFPRNALKLASWAPYDGVDGCEFLRLLITDGQLRFEGETRWNNNNTFGLPETWWIYWVIFKKRVN